MRIEGTASSGTGFVVDTDGYILTNEHVINGQPSLTVIFDNGSRRIATIVASDATRDIALLKISSPSNLTALPIATAVREGDEVVALGHPLNLGGSMTITKGIVSAFRNIRGVAYIQTDAAINPGNSGGPLVNLKGEVVGMNTSAQRDIQGEDYSAQGIGFAIKFDVLSRRLTAMKAGQSSQPTPVPTQGAIATQPSQYVFGPESGSIDHDPDDGLIDVHRANVSISDGIIEARFFNPYSNREGTWSYGFLIRNSGRNRVHMVVISSQSGWYHYLRTGDVDSEQELIAEYSMQINTEPLGSNHMQIVAKGTEGWLFINGGFVGSLDLSGLTADGDIHAVGSFFRNDAISGKSTRFEEFTIRSMRKVYGPRDGNIRHETHETGFIDDHETYKSVADGIFEARFHNPYASWQGDWSSGFIIRSNGEGSFHAIVVEEGGYWVHRLRTGDAGASHELATRHSSLISTTPNNDNQIRVVALGDTGWLFINDAYIASLDLSGLTNRGRVSAVTNFFTGDGLAGYSTRFEDFTIWSADGR